MTDQPPPDLSQWSLHCFCLRARSNPKRVIRMDNNGEVLWHLDGGATREELRLRGIDVTQSQLALLETYRLIEANGAGYGTRIPMLGPDRIAHLRQTARDMARTSLPDVVTHAHEIAALLADRAVASHTFAVVFGHALDGVLWDVLRSRGALPEVELTGDEPLWRGTFWAIYPGREGSSGTNEVPGERGALVMVWDDATADSLAALASDRGVAAVLGSVRPGTRSVAVRGTPVPVIDASDAVHRASRVLAHTVAATIPDGPIIQAKLRQVGVACSPEDATVILTHEVIWEVSDALGRSGVVTVPNRSHLEARLFVRVGS